VQSFLASLFQFIPTRLLSNDKCIPKLDNTMHLQHTASSKTDKKNKKQQQQQKHHDHDSDVRVCVCEREFHINMCVVQRTVLTLPCFRRILLTTKASRLG
jgi:hypothetical protein